MSTSTPPADRPERQTATDPTSAKADPEGQSDEGLVEPEGTNASGPDDPADGDPDVRSGGHSGQAPRSLTESEARWQDHESSGASWDSADSI